MTTETRHVVARRDGDGITYEQPDGNIPHVHEALEDHVDGRKVYSGARVLRAEVDPENIVLESLDVNPKVATEETLRTKA